MIFLSYSRKDLRFAEALIHFLRLHQEEVWVDLERLDLLLPLEPQLQSAIRSSNAFLLLRSRSALESKWVQFELSEALERGVPVFHLPHVAHFDPATWVRLGQSERNDPVIETNSSTGLTHACNRQASLLRALACG
jgi:TIR domain